METSSIDNKLAIVANIRVALLTKNYEEMTDALRRLVDYAPELSWEELEWLSVAYKHCVNSRRSSWHTVRNALDRAELLGNVGNITIAETMLRDIEKEMRFHCKNILQMLEQKIIPNAKDDNTMVLCHKLIGDYNRCLAEFEVTPAIFTEKSFNAYREAYKIGTKKLEAVSPVYLAMVLNYSLFLYEILNEPKDALDILVNVRNRVVMHKDAKKLDEETNMIFELINQNIGQWGQREEAKRTLRTDNPITLI
ncbi:14-3-3 family protein artA-like [Teleopsis dalmanni]|uniref:14-3-3 family protein artA-like n=1 Tax=Teleopsis dalmanni TaxID=139649 RepID=UPI0018CF72DB|nr:14-3-3 family protein artA-like [Teleopsis dalmanni]